MPSKCSLQAAYRQWQQQRRDAPRRRGRPSIPHRCHRPGPKSMPRNATSRNHPRNLCHQPTALTSFFLPFAGSTSLFPFRPCVFFYFSSFFVPPSKSSTPLFLFIPLIFPLPTVLDFATRLLNDFLYFFKFIILLLFSSQ